MSAATKTPPEARARAYDVERLRAEFPILSRTVHGKPLVYLDNANTTQKPRVVIDAIRRYYEEENANIHRGTHWLSEKATEAYEGGRAKVARFLGAASPKEIVFTRGTTEAINLVASSFSQAYLKAGDEILITGLEHHSNIVPWQLACERTGAKLVVVPITDDGEVPVDEFEKRLTPRTKLAAVSHVSNALGTINPVKQFIALAHARNVPVLVDGAQAAPHLPIDVTDLGCDFYAVSAHKMYGPTGIGALYGTEEWLEKLPPYQGGGDMIASVTFEKTTYNAAPVEIRGGHREHRGRDRLRRGGRLAVRRGPPGRRRARARPPRPRHPEALGHSRPHDRGPREREGGRDLVRSRKRAPARHRHDPRPRRDRDPHGPPLRAAGHGPLRHSGDGPRVFRALQHARRSRCARGRSLEGFGDVRMTDLRDLYQEVILDHNKSPTTTGRWRTRRASRSATTRSAATR